jgi:tryptophan halogenase
MKSVNKIIIVGGGTSGWAAAAHLSKSFEVTLINKEKDDRVGVGEATLLNFASFMKSCGFAIEHWIDEIDATYKSGILFKNWNIQNCDIWHPFLDASFGESKSSMVDTWSKCQDLDFKTYACGLYELSMNRKINDDYLNESYAFHIDCNLLVKFFQKHIQNRINYIQSEVTNIIRNNDGSIKELLLANQQTISGDLYLDCTGFKRLLSHDSDLISLQDRLFCNTAIATHVQYKNDDSEFNPYVICDAVDHGWIWHIPTRSRLGSGLVFNRDITPIQEAKEYFVNYWDSRITVDTMKVLDWTPYYDAKFWNNNVVSIGLSAGFIEPLESTGLALIFSGIQQLYDQIAAYKYHPSDIGIYNSIMKHMFETSVDFINMHYYNSQRGGKFWDYVRSKHVMNESHKHYVEEMLSPILNTKFYNSMFTRYNWYTWMVQLGHTITPKNNKISSDQARLYLKEFFQTTNKLK